MEMAAAGDLADYQVGRRFVCEGLTGTILYIGKVPPIDGVWLGVEWDDVSRGKHSGDHEGVHYFTCSREGSGSFVRPKKISLGCTFIEAVQERYGGSGGGEEEKVMYVDVKPVEVIGTDKITKRQSQYDRLSHANLRGMYVSSAGRKEGEIRQTTPSIQMLNLSCNPLLPSWEVVASITVQLPKLTSLELSENKLLRLTSIPSVLSPSFSSLRELFINRMELKWQQVSVILSMLPQLEDLHVCQNKISDLRCESENYSQFPEGLQLLNLEENQVTDWSEIMRLHHLSKLKTLILNDNKLICISLHQAKEEVTPKHQEHHRGSYFPALQCLSINDNCISDWTSLNALNSLPSLTELKFKDNPVTSGELSFTSRQMIIARIGRLTTLNNSSVSVRERQLAERQYLKQYAQEWMESETNESKRLQFSREHPRFSNLVKEQGLPEDALVAHKPATTALKHGLISVTIKCPDSAEKELTKKLPGTMTVQKLKGLLQRLYKVDSSEQKLSYLDSRGDREIELDDDLKQLSYYSIATGDTILLRW